MKTKPNDKVNADILVSEYVGSPKYKTNKYHHEQQGGLTKREYFTALAMQGLLAHYGMEDIDNLVKESILATDALIEELNKSQNQ